MCAINTNGANVFKKIFNRFLFIHSCVDTLRFHCHNINYNNDISTTFG